MGKVLYEVHFQFDPMMLVPVIMMVVFFWPPITRILFSRIEEEESEVSRRFQYNLLTAGRCFLVVLVLITIVAQVRMHSKTIGAYKSGEFEIVEGYVENFDPMPYSGHAHESFEIDGVYFEYSDYNHNAGYHNAKSHGGVITGDGQYLKVGYIYYNSTYGNVIVYIEELPRPQ